MIELSYKNKLYKLDKENLLFVLSKFENRKVNTSEIDKLMEKYKLYDEYFLENINKL